MLSMHLFIDCVELLYGIPLMNNNRVIQMGYATLIFLKNNRFICVLYNAYTVLSKDMNLLRGTNLQISFEVR